MTLFVEAKDIWKNEFGFCTVSINRCQKSKKEKKKTSKKGKITNWCPFLQNN